MKTNITSRAGNFTSSSIHKLMKSDKSGLKFGAPALTYIDIKKREVKLGRQMEQQKSFRSSAWGTMMQYRVLNFLITSTEYKPVSDKRFEHPVLPLSGSPDFICEDRIGDVKCFELDNFTFTHDMASLGYESLKKECPDIFWQLVSNAILCEKTKAELILYVPYKNEIPLIRDEDEWSNFLTPEQFEDKNFKWWINSLSFMDDDELPYLLPMHHYPNLSTFQFDIPESDRLALTNRIIMANKIL